jgi:hypothetical protein
MKNTLPVKVWLESEGMKVYECLEDTQFCHVFHQRQVPGDASCKQTQKNIGLPIFSL